MSSTPPLSTEPLAFHFPETFSTELADGTAVHVIQKSDEDLITVQLYMESAAAHDTVRGASAFAAHLMTSGAGVRSSEEFDLAVESLGCSIRATVDRSVCTVTGLGMADNTEPLLELMSDVVLRPRFEAAELENLRRRWINEMQVDHRDPDWLANQACNRVSFSHHPYRHPVRGEISHMKALQREDVVAAHQRILRSPRTIIVAGPLSPQEVLDHVSRSFNVLPASTYDNTLPIAKVQERTACVAVNPDTIQTSFRIALPGLAYDHPDFAALQLLTNVLGGYSLARLFMVLREQKGYTYGAYAANAVRQHSQTTDIMTSVGNDFTADTIDIIASELRRISIERIYDDELENARQNLIGMLARANETPQQTASLVWTMIRDGLAPDYFSELFSRIQLFTPDDLLRVQSQWFNVERWAIGVSGDPDIVVPAISGYVDSYEVWDPSSESAE